MDGVEMYRSGRERALELGRSLNREQADLVVPATPLWSVRDNFAHMAGVAADVIGGNVEGVATDPWTQAQVDARSDCTLTEILDELEQLGGAMDDLITVVGDAMDPRLFLDQWTHEQDVRATVGIPGGADAPVVPWGAPLVVAGWLHSVRSAGLPALRVVCDGADSTSGENPRVDLVVDSFTAIRVVTGRRSARQLAALAWSGPDDPTQYFEHLVAFSIPERDVDDVR